MSDQDPQPLAPFGPPTTPPVHPAPTAGWPAYSAAPVAAPAPRRSRAAGIAAATVIFAGAAVAGAVVASAVTGSGSPTTTDLTGLRQQGSAPGQGTPPGQGAMPGQGTTPDDRGVDPDGDDWTGSNRGVDPDGDDWTGSNRQDGSGTLQAPPAPPQWQGSQGGQGGAPMGPGASSGGS